MKTVALRSPAKLNLLLKVLNKRPDGYHELRTIFERIDLCDDLTFSPNRLGKIRITCDHPHVPLGPRNLAYRAARLLQERFAVRKGVDIRITKRIPVAAGLAGGSSNGATALLGLTRLWNLRISQAELCRLGQVLGSDVPFFLYDCSWALGEGRGDAITPLKIPGKYWHLLVVPRIKVYSREVFRAHNLQLTKKGDDVNILTRSLINKNIRQVENLLSNDLEPAILALWPRLKTAKARVQSLLKGVSFSGSGPAIYGLADSERQAQQLKERLGRYYRQVFAVRTL